MNATKITHTTTTTSPYPYKWNHTFPYSPNIFPTFTLNIQQSFSLFIISRVLSISFHPSDRCDLRNMFGGGNSNPVFPAIREENQLHYNANALPRLQLFGDFTVGCSVGPLNYMRNGTATLDRPIKRGREGDSISRKQKCHISLNSNLCQDEAGQSASILNPNVVSTGLRLSYEEDEPNSSVTSVSESMNTALPVIMSLDNGLKIEIDRQKEEFECYIKLQEENIIKGVRELKQRHISSFLGAIDNGVGKKLREKELEMETMNCKNKELVERIKQVAVEVQTWHYRAKYNESLVSVLKSNLQQVMAQGAMHRKEGYGDSEVDGAASYPNHNHMGVVDCSGNSLSTRKQITCRACKVKEVSVLLLPCRHLCMCNGCEGFIYVCPVCRVMKTASVQVYLS